MPSPWSSPSSSGTSVPVAAVAAASTVMGFLLAASLILAGTGTGTSKGGRAAGGGGSSGGSSRDDDDDDVVDQAARSSSSSSSSSSSDHPHAARRGGYGSLIGNTPLLYLPNVSSLLATTTTTTNNNDRGDHGGGTRIYVKMESANPGGTGKDRAALSMIADAEGRGELPPPLGAGAEAANDDDDLAGNGDGGIEIAGGNRRSDAAPSRATTSSSSPSPSPSSSSSSPLPPPGIPPDVHSAILVALRNSRTGGIVVEGTSGSTGISLASLCTSRGHGSLVVLPDDQSSQKAEYLRRLGCGVVVVKNCGISNPDHYVNVARRAWEWMQVDRRYDGFYWECVVRRRDGRGEEKSSSTARKTPPRLIRAAFMDQFENPANVASHYATTGPEIRSQVDGGRVDAFVMSAGTGGTLVGVGGYLKERWHREDRRRRRCRSAPPDDDRSPSSMSPMPPRIVLVDPPGSSLYNKVKFGVAYASQQSERRLRRHRYDTLAEGIGLDRVTANFGLGCEDVRWDEDGDGGGGEHDGADRDDGGGAFGRRIEDLARDRAGGGAGGRSQDNGRGRPAVASLAADPSKVIDDAVSVTDQQAVHMAHLLLRLEGLFVGSSTAMNVVGALRVAANMPRGSNVVTVCCDGGQRHTSRFWNRDFIVNERGLVWPGDEDGGAARDDGDDGRRNERILELLGIDIAENAD